MRAGGWRGPSAWDQGRGGVLLVSRSPGSWGDVAVPLPHPSIPGSRNPSSRTILADFLSPAPTPSPVEIQGATLLLSPPELAIFAVTWYFNFTPQDAPPPSSCTSPIKLLWTTARPQCSGPHEGFSSCFLNAADYDECASQEDDCAPGSACRNTLGSFTCSCEGGAPDLLVEFSGRPCEGNIIRILCLEYHQIVCSFKDTHPQSASFLNEVNIFLSPGQVSGVYVCMCRYLCVYLCICVHVCACVCMCIYSGTSPSFHTPPAFWRYLIS